MHIALPMQIKKILPLFIYLSLELKMFDFAFSLTKSGPDYFFFYVQ